MPRIVGPCLLHSTIPIFFKNPGGFEFLGSMSFNQTELAREGEGDHPRRWVQENGSRQASTPLHCRRSRGGFNPPEEKRLKLHRPSSIEETLGKIAASIAASRM